jgi:hypothetical protein
MTRIKSPMIAAILVFVELGTVADAARCRTEQEILGPVLASVIRSFDWFVGWHG